MGQGSAVTKMLTVSAKQEDFLPVLPPSRSHQPDQFDPPFFKRPDLNSAGYIQCIIPNEAEEETGHSSKHLCSISMESHRKTVWVWMTMLEPIKQIQTNICNKSQRKTCTKKRENYYTEKIFNNKYNKHNETVHYSGITRVKDALCPLSPLQKIKIKKIYLKKTVQKNIKNYFLNKLVLSVVTLILRSFIAG